MAMIANTNNSGDERFRTHKQSEAGFSLIEVMISMVVLTVGLVSLLSVFGLAMSATQTSQQDMIAKQLANEALESIITARNTSQTSWDDIQNSGSTTCTITGAATCGVFVGGLQPIYNSGADGIYGTSDDSAAGEETLREPGADGIYNTADDVSIPLIGYQRSIAIGTVNDSDGNPITTFRSVNITVQYHTNGTNIPKTYVVNTFFSEYQ
jgi:prepilin-type N-terminal cleavage/methylation domain-containing protein